MSDAVLLAGDRYHNADDAFAGVGPALEAAGRVCSIRPTMPRLMQIC